MMPPSHLTLIRHWRGAALPCPFCARPVEQNEAAALLRSGESESFKLAHQRCLAWKIVERINEEEVKWIN